MDDTLMVPTVEARSNFSDIISRASYGNVTTVLTRRGKPVAAIVSPETLALLNRTKRRVSYQLSIVEDRVERLLSDKRMPDIRILGINATGPLHQGLELLTHVLLNGGSLRLLLLNPLDPAFTKRMDAEHDIVGRLQAELFASFYIVMDIMKRVPAGEISLRLHNAEPDRSLILINPMDSDGIVLENPYPRLHATRGLTGKMYTWLKNMEGGVHYNDDVAYFNRLWEGGLPIQLAPRSGRLNIAALREAGEMDTAAAQDSSLGLWPFVITT